MLISASPASALSDSMVAMYLLAVATLVSVIMSQLVKPTLERVPALSAEASDQTLHDVTLRAASVALNTIFVLALAAANGQLTLHNTLPTALTIIATSLGSHLVYTGVRKKAKATATVSTPSTATTLSDTTQSSAPYSSSSASSTADTTAAQTATSVSTTPTPAAVAAASMIVPTGVA